MICVKYVLSLHFLIHLTEIYVGVAGYRKLKSEILG